MADKRISELPNLAEIQDDALLVVEYNGIAYFLTGAQLKAYAASVGSDGDMKVEIYDPEGLVAQSGGVDGYVSGVVGDIDTILDSVNGEMNSNVDGALDELNGEVV